MPDSVRGLGRDITKTISEARKRESCDLISDNKYNFRPCSQ